MTQGQFTAKYNGRYVDYDGVNSAQCTDLMRAFIKEVRGLQPYVAVPSTGWAKNIFYNFVNNSYYKKVYNGPTNYPKKGDLVFWKTYPLVTGIAGHVAICESADSMNLLVFSQNYPKDSPCVFRKFSYRGVIGWLTPTT